MLKIKNLVRTRLFGHLQPQMYPSVALSQYTWVNRTHNIAFYIYASRPHEHFEQISQISHKSYPLNNM